MNSTKYSNSRSHKKLPKDFRHPSENQRKIGHPTQFLGNILYPSEFQIFHIPPHWVLDTHWGTETGVYSSRINKNNK